MATRQLNFNTIKMIAKYKKQVQRVHKNTTIKTLEGTHLGLSGNFTGNIRLQLKVLRIIIGVTS